MTKLKRMIGIVSSAIMLLSAATACDKTDNSSVSESTDNALDSVDTENKENNSDYFSDFDLNTTYDNPDAEITLNNENTKINGNGAVFENNKVSINSGGTFIFSGTLDDGQIYVNSQENVHLVFNGVNITNKSSSPVFVENAKNTSVTLVDKTENTLSDTENYVFENTEENEPDAVIFSKDDFSVNGNGTLTINANYNEGITCKNDIRLAGGNISIKSVGNAIKGKDSVVVQNTNLNISSGEDGIKSSNTEETDKGYIVIESGEFNITAGNDAVQSENFLTVNGGTLNFTTGGGADSVPVAMQEMPMGGGNRNFTESGMQMPTDENGNPAMPDMQMPTDENGNPAMPDMQMPADENGNPAMPDMQMPTDENGNPAMPENFAGFGGGRMDRDSFESVQTETGTEETVESQKGLKSSKTITKRWFYKCRLL